MKVFALFALVIVSLLIVVSTSNFPEVSAQDGTQAAGDNQLWDRKPNSGRLSLVTSIT